LSENSSSNRIIPPRIDSRNYKEILGELRHYAKFYVPEWDPNNEDDIGVALSKVFCHIMIDVIDRLNKRPHRNYIEFLNILGTKLSQGRAARANVIFSPPEGIKNKVLVKTGTRVLAPANEKHDEIIFETTENLLVTNSKLVDVWSISGRKINKDGIYQHTQDHIANLQFNLFLGLNQQKHILYLRDQVTFGIKPDSSIQLEFSSNNGAALTTILKNAQWEYNWKPDPDNTNQEIASKFYVETLQKKNTCTVYLSLVKYGRVKFDKYIVKVGDVLNMEIQAAANLDKKSVTVKSTTDPRGRIINLQRIPNSERFYGNIKLLSTETVFLAQLDEEILLVHEGDIVTAIFKENNLESSTAATVNSGEVPRVEENDVDSMKGNWIRCAISPQHFGLLQDDIKSLKIDDIQIWNQPVSDSFRADMLFYNNVPLDSEPLFPFGEKPILLDTFYVGCESVLSKKNTIITLSFKCLNQNSLFLRSGKLVLSWEYWNGTTWASFKLIDQALDIISQWIKFLCPADISKTDVNGVENFWIRCRIVSGDYGKEKLVPVGNPPVYKVDVTEILFPIIYNVNLSFAPNRKNPDGCISNNNLEYMDHIIKVDRTLKPFIPFYGLPEERPAVYLGFNKQLGQGPLNLYISIHQFDYQENDIRTINNTSSISYYYYSERERGWKELDLVDGTRNYMKSGYLKILIPSDISKYSLFGKENYWIKGIDKKSIFESSIKDERKCPGHNNDNASDSMKEKSSRILPYINGLYLNVVPSVNLTKVKEEIIGSSNGERNQIFKLSKTPVVSSDSFQTEMWINESKYISEEELEKLKKTERIREVKGLDGVVREIWVYWDEVDDMMQSEPTDRCYESDNAVGLIKFGDGIHGKIPPIGRDNIKVNYHRGGGITGNVKGGKISLIKTPIQFTESVMNPEPANGGMDIECVENALLRGPQFLKHRGQAVTPEDFEWLVREQFPSVAKVKCLPNSWTRGEFRPGHVTVVAVPESNEDKPRPSLELMEMIERYLHTCSSDVISNSMRVISPVFIKISVTADVYVKSIELVSELEKESKESLKKFLHPLRGGIQGKGWDLGSFLCFSDLYFQFHKIAGIDHIENLSIDVELEENTGLADLSECKRICKIEFDDIADSG
jgi:hypothetical protein